MDEGLEGHDAPAIHQSSVLNQIPIEVLITVGKARPLVRDLMELGENSVLPLDRRVDEPVEVYIGDRLIARGELQELDGGEQGQLAVKLTEVINDPTAIK